MRFPRFSRWLVSTVAVFNITSFARAEIFQWEYVYPDSTQFKQQSATLAPDGAGLVAAPAVNLDGKNLTKAYLPGANLLSSSFRSAILTDAYFANGNLADANFTGAYIRGADFTADRLSYNPEFGFPTGITPQQLYSTASYLDGDLRGVGLERNRLANVILAGKNLSGANIKYATLTSANFSGANLTGADLQQANLISADLSQADLTGAKLSFATLTGADFDGAHVRGAQFYGAGITVAQLASTASYLARDLGAIDLSQNNLANADFASHGLTGAKFVEATLIGANFNHAELANAQFGLASLSNATFLGANLTNASLDSADLTEANFGQASLTNAVLAGAKLTGADLTGAEVRGASFSRGGDYGLLGSGITPAQLYSTASYEAEDLSSIQLRGNNLPVVNLAGQKVVNADFSGGGLNGADLRGADAQGARFVNAVLTAADLSRANLKNTVLAGAQLAGANLSRADLTNAIFYSYPVGTADLAGANLSHANLTDVRLEYANLTNANLSNANLTRAWLLNVPLTGADFSGVDLRGVRITGYLDNSTNVYVNGITPEQLYSASSYLAGDLSGARFEGMQFAGVNLAGMNLTGAVFESSDLSGADLSQADLTGARFTLATLTNADFTDAEVRGASFFHYSSANGGTGITTAQLYSTASYKARDLTGIGLQYHLFAGVNFAGQNLTNAAFADSTLSGADLTQANLTNASFFNANLTGADLTGADVRGASFRLDANYGEGGTGITVAQLYSTASYKTGDLTGVELWGNNLTGAYLAGQNLTNAGFNSATLTSANLSQANLAGADLRSARLTSANLTQTNLTGAIFTSVTMSGANLTGAIVQGTRFDFSTITRTQLASTASYQAHDMSGISLIKTNMSNANFTLQNLSDVNLAAATLTGAIFTDAEVRGANLSRVHTEQGGATYTGTGISPAQLAATASYKAKDLTGIRLPDNNLVGANFVGQNLTNADFEASNLTNANFTGADLTGANFLTAILRGANLGAVAFPHVDFGGADLTGANLTGADIRGSSLTRIVGGTPIPKALQNGAPINWAYSIGTGISLAQLMTTASYAAHDLSDVTLGNNDFNGGDFAGFNLTNANYTGSTFVGADLSGADARGTAGSIFNNLNLTGALVTNLIRPDGHVRGLNLGTGDRLVIRDYDGHPVFGLSSIPIAVDQSFAMGPGGTLRMEFEADPWDSMISFAAGIPVALGGTLELTFAADVNLASQVGRTIDLFNWTGGAPTGAFTVESAYTWNLSQLYTTGEVTLTAVPEPSTLLLLCLGSLAVLWRRKGLVRASILAVAIDVNFADSAAADTFGSGANTFDIEFVTIGNPGNAPDDVSANPDFAGSVPYTYRMGKFEISEQIIDKANALGGLAITKDTRGPDKPATSTSWNEAARFVNWLNISSGRTPAYKFAIPPGEPGYNASFNNIQLWTIGDAGYNPNNLYRNSLARYFLPSVDEWYKAAHYDPINGVYYDYPTGSDSTPTAVANGTASGTAVYGQSSATGPADITLAGGLSPYGTIGQGGNVWEMEETDSDLLNGSFSSERGLRGGNWTSPPIALLASFRNVVNPDILGAPNYGFRVASIAVPEPSTLLLLCFGSLAVLWRRRGLVCASILAAVFTTSSADRARGESLEWTRQLGTSAEDRSNRVSADGLGNIYISGCTTGSLGGPNAGSADAFVSKYDAAGTLQWSRQLGTFGGDVSNGVSADGLGNVYISGYTQFSLGGPSAGSFDAFVSKYDTAGTLQWSRQLGPSSFDESRGVSADGLGNVYFSGYTRGSLGGPNAGGDDAFVVKIVDSVVPEPSTLLLLCFGSLAVLRRRRHLICASILAAVVCTASSAQAADIRTVALRGQQAPGTPSGVNFSGFLPAPVLNDAGQTAFVAGLTGSGVDSTNITGIWSEGSGSVALVARAGDHAPGTLRNSNKTLQCGWSR